MSLYVNRETPPWADEPDPGEKLAAMSEDDLRRFLARYVTGYHRNSFIGQTVRRELGDFRTEDA